MKHHTHTADCDAHGCAYEPSTEREMSDDDRETMRRDFEREVYANNSSDEPATGQISPKTQVEGSRATNPPSAPAAAPDAQTPRMDELLLEIHEGRTYQDNGPIVDLGRQLERENADLRRQLAEAKDNGYKMFMACGEARQRAETAEAELKRINPLYTAACIGQRDAEAALAAERAIPRACRALEQNEVGAPCSYLQDAEAALAAERQRAEKAELLWCEHSSKREEVLRELAAERAAREAAVNSDILTRSMLVAVERHLKFAERERATAADLAKEECAKICDDVARDYDKSSAFEYLAAAIRVTITDPAAVKATLDDAARFQSLPKWMAAIVWNKKSDLPTLGTLKDGFALDDLRVWLDDANAAHKGEEGNRE